MPCRAATNPPAQNNAAPVPQAMPPAVAEIHGAKPPDWNFIANGLIASYDKRVVWVEDSRTMAALDTVSIGILLSLIAMRFGAPLLLVFLIVGMLAGEAGPGGIKFDDVYVTYVVGSIALALILFDGGLRTRFATFRSVLGPAATLATAGVLLTAALTAPVARLVLGLSWTEALLVGAVVASTDAAAVFFLIHSRGLRLRPRVGATLEVESASNDPFAVLMTVLLVEFLAIGDRTWQHVLEVLVEQTVIG